MSYSNIFGGDEIDPSSVQYAAYSFDANLSLVWPFEALDGTEVAANIIDGTATVASLLVSMPNCTLVSTGQSNLFNNVGAQAFTVVDYSGNTLINILPGEQWLIYLTDNSTVNGTWRVVRYGASTSSANASALAGFGLRANITKLDQNIVATSLAADYPMTANDRAQLLMNTGGVVTWSIADAGVLGNGWFVYAANEGSGVVTIDPYSGQTIDGNPTKLLNPGESCIVFCTGSNFVTVGYGRSLVSTVSAVAINAAGTGVLNLNSTQIAAQVQDFSGALTGNRTIDYGGGVGYWFVWNNTSGAYTMTHRVNNLDPGVVVPQGNYTILRSNGTLMEVAFTATTGTVTQVNTVAGETTGGPITGVGSIGLANTAVTPATYGSASRSVVATVDQKGRATAMSDVAIAITGSQVTDLASIIAAAILAAIPVGTIEFDATNNLPTGWLYAGGGTIGNASSNATSRANADTAALYTGLWNSDSNLVIYTSGGVVTTRGVSAAADYAANKALALPDYRNRALFGRGDMGPLGSSGRITVLKSGIDGNSLGATGGQQSETTTTSASGSTSGSLSVTATGSTTIPQGDPPKLSGANTIDAAGSLHTHDVTVNGSTAGSLSVTTTGNTTEVTNMPPAAICNVRIKYA